MLALRLLVACFTALTALACSNSDDRGDASDGDPKEPEPQAEPDTTPKWESVLDSNELPWLLSSWGTRKDNRYAAGGTLEAGVILHFDGERWEPETLPPDTALVNWLFGLAEDQIYAVANQGGALFFDGEQWQAMATPTQQDLWGVWAASPRAVWAVGGTIQSGGVATILFFDGESWTDVTPPVARPNVKAYFKVWGTSADNVYVVGQNGVAQHFDGEDWKELNVGASDDLISLWGTSPDNIVAVGGRSSAVVAHFNGEDWNTETLFEVQGANGVWMRKPDVAHLALTAGYTAKLSLPDFEIELEPLDYLDFHALYGTRDGTLTAVGLNQEALATMEYNGLLFERELEDDE
jgi:hypothetical protein